MKISLKKLEARLQNLVEGTINKFIPLSLKRENIISKLVEAMHAGVQSSLDGELIAPNLYALVLSLKDVENLSGNTVLLEGLSLYLDEAGREAGYVFPTFPVVKLETGSNMASGEFSIRAINSLSDISPTEGISLDLHVKQNQVPKNAYVIIDGTEVFSLDSVLINIGRRSDNQLVIADSSVSRLHAQLRAKDGMYQVFDLDSASGTKVNGKRIHQCELNSGDVLTIGQIPLVYIQDETES